MPAIRLNERPPMRPDAPALTLDGTARIGGLHVFGPLHLTVPAGRITCLLGPSGVGKTTLLRLIARVGLQDHAHKRPGALSGGQKQRVALARTLMEDRPVILLDEPFSALDARTRTQMQDLAAEHLKGRTVLMVTHDPAEAARMGHAIHILTETGLEDVTPPPGTVPRPVDDPETLTAQGRLLARLRAPA